MKKVFLDLPEKPPVLVLDADALNILSGISKWWKRLPAGTVLTPHAGEMARLLGTSIDDVQRTRLETARKASLEWKKTVVLKGAFSIIAEPGGNVRVSDAANAGLATAGTGDVLAGAVAGMAAQGISIFNAASLGVYLHAQAGEAVREDLGDAGMLAGDLLPVLPKVIKRLKER